MKKNILRILAILLFFGNILLAQNSISGTVKDDQNEHIYFATVALIANWIALLPKRYLLMKMATSK